jgi:hypothetical protein
MGRAFRRYFVQPRGQFFAVYCWRDERQRMADPVHYYDSIEEARREAKKLNLGNTEFGNKVGKQER